MESSRRSRAFIWFVTGLTTATVAFAVTNGCGDDEIAASASDAGPSPEGSASPSPAATPAGGGSDANTAPADGGPPDASTADAAVAYHALGDPRNWAFFDLHATANFGPTVNVFDGAMFDGRYVYYPPAQGSGIGTTTVMVRHDTTGDFTSRASWESLDLRNLPLGAAEVTGGDGAMFDGRYAYFTPFTPSGAVIRYDTHAAFGDPDAGAWDVFRLALDLDGRAGSLGEGAFDGRYVYIPRWTNAVTVRFDTKSTASFHTPTPWEAFDLRPIVGDTGAFHAVFDGHYIYYVPLQAIDAGTTTLSGVVARFDATQPSFSQSWTSFDVSTLPSSPKGFLGGVFDGRYVYFTPYDNDSPLVTRYDTTQAFDVAGSYGSTPKGPASATSEHGRPSI